MRITTIIPNRYKYYPTRSSNSLKELKNWVNGYAKKQFPKSKFILVSEYKKNIQDKKNRDYWKMRYKNKLENKYYIYTNFTNE